MIRDRIEVEIGQLSVWKRSLEGKNESVAYRSVIAVNLFDNFLYLSYFGITRVFSDLLEGVWFVDSLKRTTYL